MNVANVTNDTYAGKKNILVVHSTSFLSRIFIEKRHVMFMFVALFIDLVTFLNFIINFIISIRGVWFPLICLQIILPDGDHKTNPE